MTLQLKRGEQTFFSTLACQRRVARDGGPHGETLRRAPARRFAVSRAMQLTLLVRAYCHLCDEMLEALRPLSGSTPLEVLDVDADHPAWKRTSAMLVPVLFAGSPGRRTSSATIGSTGARRGSTRGADRPGSREIR